MKLFFLWGSLFINLHVAKAQHYNFNNISTKEGLPSNFVYRVYEDKKGYHWYLTDKGICRFDGVAWKYFSSDQGYTDVGAFHITESIDGVLWFITTNFKLYEFKNNKFKKIPIEGVAWIDIDHFGNKWVLTRNNEIFLYNSKGLTLYPIREKLKGQAYSILRMLDNDFILATSFGIYRLRNKDRALEVIIRANTFENFIPPRIFKRYNGNVILANHQGVFDYEPITSRISLIMKLRNNELFSFCEDSISSTILLGTFNGLFLLKENYNKKLTKATLLDSKIISSIINLNEGGVAFSTLNYGVYSCDFNVIHYTVEDGLDQDNISFIKAENRNIYFFSTNGSLYTLFKTKPIQLKPKGLTLGTTGRIENVVNMNDTALLISTNNTYRIQNRKISSVKFEESDRGFFWLHNKDEAICRPIQMVLLGQKTIKQLDIWRYLKENKLDISVSRTIGNSNNRAYFQMKSSILELQFNDDKVYGHRVFKDLEFVSDVKLMDDGTVLFSTENEGVVVIRKGERKIFSNIDGIASNYCKRLYIRNNVIWVCTNKGLTRFLINSNSLKIKSIKNFTKSNVLIDNEVNDLFFYGDSVFVGTDKGVSVFKNSYESKPTPSEVFLEKIEINNIDTPISSSYTLPYNYNNINITYSSPNRMELLFKYSLEDTITDISYTKLNELRLGSLMPGYYKLHIWAQNSEGVWSIKPIIVTLNILRPFWKSVWFIGVVLMLLLGLSLIFFSYRYRQIKERNLIQNQLLDSELKALRLHMNPHFIFNTLNSLQKFILERNPLEANKYIAKFAKLMRWILSYADKQHITLEEELLFLDTYIELEQLRFDKVFKVVKEVDENLQVSQVFIPALVIQPFVENAIKYGITGIAYQGTLTLRFTQLPDYLKVTIQDNGVGRELVKQEQEFSGKEFESTGIKYTNERLLLLLNGKLNIQNAVSITDLYEQGKPAGTQVELIIPYYNE